MQFENETGWKLYPLDGETGQAYMGTKDQEKLFVKLNTSPFLAALSMEGISPRLVWTKRIGSGDVITAQEWCNGRNLSRKEMDWKRVAHILKKLHSSVRLKKMLQNVGGSRTLPEDLINDFEMSLPVEIANHPTVKEALNQVYDHIDQLAVNEEFVVCHGDTSHKNWLLSDEDELYLVDWDSVAFADPAYDIGQLLSRYLNKDQWSEWLKAYDGNYTEFFERRVYLYSLLCCSQDIKSSFKRQHFNEMNQAILKLDQLLK